MEYLSNREPPNNVEAEASILGAMLIDNSIIDTVVTKVSKDKFYKDNHKLLFENIVELNNSTKSINRKVDIVTLSELLRKKKILKTVGGAPYVVALMEIVSTSANVDSHINIVKDKHKRRVAIEASERLIQASHNEGDVDLQVNNLNASMDVLGGLNVESQALLADCFDPTLREIEEVMENDGVNKNIVYTNFAGLDRKLILLKENLVVLAARPAVGKSAFVLNLAYNASKDNKVGIISLEMGEGEIMKRLIAMVCKVNGLNIVTGNLSDSEYQQVLDKGAEIKNNKNIVIDDDYKATLDDIMQRCRRLKNHHKVDCIIIDYLQLISAKGYSKNDEVGQMSRKLKLLAKELRVPIIVLSQLNRAVETRVSNKPYLSDLRDSGSIEQDADTVVFLWKEGDDEGNMLTNISIAKQRHASTGEIMMSFNKELQTFSEV